MLSAPFPQTRSDWCTVVSNIVAFAGGAIVTWESVANKWYFLERSVNLGSSPEFSTIQSRIPGQPGTTTFTDTNALGPGPFFYRVRVQP